jgi:mRNA-degrading endonuclease toxin of MazEF toxin-antitoxin module
MVMRWNIYLVNLDPTVGSEIIDALSFQLGL